MLCDMADYWYLQVSTCIISSSVHESFSVFPVLLLIPFKLHSGNKQQQKFYFIIVLSAELLIEVKTF